MKRPMVLAGAGSLVISAIALYAPQHFFLVFIILMVAVAAAFILLRFKGFIKFAPIFLFLILLCLRTANEIQKLDRVNAFKGELVIAGTVTEVDYYEQSAAYYIKTDSINGETFSCKLRLSINKGYYREPGDKITLTATLDDGKPNLAYGTYGNLIDGEILECEQESNVYSFTHSVRQYIKKILFSDMSYDSASLTMGLTVGDKGFMDEGLSENVRRSGVSHIVVVSGMHLAIITGALLKIAKKYKSANLPFAVAGILLVSFIVALTGFSPSVMRASVAYYIIFISMLTGRTPDTLNSLFAAALLIVFVNPFVVGNLSFQLSAGATFGVLCVAPVISGMMQKEETLLNRIICAVLNVAATSVSALVMTMPFIFYRFGTMSLVAVATNLFVTYLSSAVLMLAVLAVAFSFLPQLCKALLFVADICAALMITIINSLGSLSFAEISFENSTLPTVLSAVLALAVGIYCFKNYDKIKRREYVADNS